ncbi:MAG: two-component regulator propeller domain-containing protein, partial [Oscillospiraceae bacterium]
MKKILKAVGVTAIGIVLNVAGRYIAYVLDLPIWLDMVGTVISSYYGGIWSGVIAGLASNVISSLYDASALVYSVINVAAAAAIHILIKKGYVNNALKAFISSFWLGVVCTILSTPLNIIFCGGYSGNTWGDTLIDMLRWHDVSNVLAALAGEAVVEIVDKQISIMLAFMIIYFISWLKKSKPSAPRTASLILAVCIISAAAIQPIESAAVSESAASDNFVEKIYNNTNGMVASEANVICETGDGYIWIGSYAGLTRYNGDEFEFIREGGLVNVVSMMTDSKGRLWIGTNDAGIARYENGEYTYFTQDDGLPSNSVRCFAEDKDGRVYVGTSSKICSFGTDDTIEVSEHDITFATAMAVCDDKLFVIDNNGSISALDGEKLLTPTPEYNEKYFYYCLASTSEGMLVGTETGELFSAEISGGNISLHEKTDISADKISALFEDSRSRIWLASGSEFGYISKDGGYRKMSIEGFDEYINCFHEDYQGNIWVASTNYGVMKLSESRFVNAFESIGAEKQVVNAVAKYRGNYFCGTDKGLIVFNENGLSDEFSELSELTDGYRVRSIYVDSRDGLWLCTYSGLIYYSAKGEVRLYNTET